MLLYDEKTLHWPLTTHCWGHRVVGVIEKLRWHITPIIALIKQFGKPEILYQCTGGNLAVTSNYVLSILALIVLENGKVISKLYHGHRLGPLSVP